MKHNFQDKNANLTVDSKTVFSDDPEAIQKIEAKIKTLTQLQVFMKATNTCIRKKDKEGFLKLEFATEKIWNELNTPDFCNRIGFPSYKLTNNNANINRLKERLKSLCKMAEKETTKIQIGDVDIIENVEANRLQIIFPSIPAESIRTQLKQNGFRWCRTEGAWQRHLSAHALYVAKQILTK